MAYSSLAEVKEIVHIPVADTTKDAELTQCVVDADKWIDNELKTYVSTFPLSPVPGMVNIASKYKAAALFREREEKEQETAEWKRFEDRAEKTLDKYIRKTYYVGVISS